MAAIAAVSDRSIDAVSWGWRRNRITLGSVWCVRASSSPKSVSADTTVRPSDRAVSMSAASVLPARGDLGDVDCVESGAAERRGQIGPQAFVDEELHAPDVSGSSRSRTASAA